MFSEENLNSLYKSSNQVVCSSLTIIYESNCTTTNNLTTNIQLTNKYKKENLVLQMTEGETDPKERKIVVGTFSQSGLSTYLPTFHYLHMTTLVFSGSTVGNGHLDQHSHYIEFTDTTNDSHDPSELATVEKGK